MNPKEKSTRELAIQWWNSIKSKNKKQLLCQNYRFSVGIQGTSWQSLTGREIEEIWNREINGECSKCRQTVQNCECHISVEEKHKGLFQMHKVLPKLLKEMKPK
jgi:hypothetical protein